MVSNSSDAWVSSLNCVHCEISKASGMGHICRDSWYIILSSSFICFHISFFNLCQWLSSSLHMCLWLCETGKHKCVCVCICCVSEIVPHLVLTKEWGAVQGQRRQYGGLQGINGWVCGCEDLVKEKIDYSICLRICPAADPHPGDGGHMVTKPLKTPNMLTQDSNYLQTPAGLGAHTAFSETPSCQT